MTEHALSFGAVAADYDRLRPRYPADAVRWALGSPRPDAPAHGSPRPEAPAHGSPRSDARTPGPGMSTAPRVVDLGAGTGILTRVALALGYDVVPVEPDPLMRAQLAASTPGTTVLAGSAESIPLADGTADGVLVGQAYHWFDRERAHPEIARVLRPGGTFAPIWNIRDDRVEWVAELSRIAHMGESSQEMLTGFGPAFGAAETGEFAHHTTLTPDELIGMIHTRSYYLTAGHDERERLDRGLRHLLATHPALAGRETVDLPYRTLVFRAHRH